MTTPEDPAPPVSGTQDAVLDPGTQPSPRVRPGAQAPGTGGSRLSAVADWLRSRADTSLGRLSLLWFRRYFEASRNSGAAAGAYVTLSVLPAALVVIAFFNLARGDENAFAQRLITHMNLDGSTASLVHDLFGTTADNVLAASVTVVIGFLVWGLSIGQLYQDVYARAWRIHVGSAADQVLFTIWFFVFSALLALMTVSGSELRTAGWLAVLPAWIAGSMVFWLWTPRFLLHRKISVRSLLPGALLATFVVGGTIATSPLWIGPTLNQNAKAFGSFGVVIALFAYILIGVTLSMVCAVFGPVWAEWRQGESGRKG
jgi:membrane protein